MVLPIQIKNMKETNFSIHSDNSSSFDEVGRQANNKTPATMAAITPAKFDNSFWVSILKGLIFNVSFVQRIKKPSQFIG